MTNDLHYTRTPPTVDGWYWWREDMSRYGIICHVYASGGVMAGVWPEYPAYRVRNIVNVGGEWAGPLREPGGEAS